MTRLSNTNRPARLVDDRVDDERSVRAIELGEKPSLLDVYRAMVAARAIDEIEADLVKRGEAFFHVSGAGHEGAAVLNLHLMDEDWLHCHYRDKALLVARGVAPEMFFHSLLCTAESHSAGRQMSAHMSDRTRRVLSIVGPVGNSALQAVGVAVEVKDDPALPIVLCSIGDGTSQQGEVLEAIAEAVRLRLPVLFWIEDNRFSISTCTREQTFFDLPQGGACEFYGLPILHLDGRDPLLCHEQLAKIVGPVRRSREPALVVFDVDRLSDHTSADDQRVYRSSDDICKSREVGDPVQIFSDRLLALGYSSLELDRIAGEVRADVARQAEVARRTVDPQPEFGAKAPLPERMLSAEYEYCGDSSTPRLTMLEAMRNVLRARLAADPRVTLLGEDIEDPKGDVFGVTRGLTEAFPGRVRNAPLTESTIVGTSIGRALAGGRPVAFLQFADFLPLAFNQIISELGSMHWRTAGRWQCPVIVMITCGGYRPGLGPFHAQTLESVATHVPGVDVFMPSTAADAAGLLNAAFESPRPTLFFYPKVFLNDRDRTTSADVERQRVTIGTARRVAQGSDLTLVSWGSTVAICEKVAAALGTAGISVDLWDLRSLAPWDQAAICDSASMTRRLLVVHEDNITCGFGAEVLAVVSERVQAPVHMRRVCRPDTYVPCNFANQLEVLPSFRSVLSAAAEMLDLDLRWDSPPEGGDEVSQLIEATGSSPADQEVTVIQWMVKPGDTVRAGEHLADLEADKAAFELTAPWDGRIESLLVEEGQAVRVGTPLMRVKSNRPSGLVKRKTREEPGTPHLVQRQPKPQRLSRRFSPAPASTVWLSRVHTVEGSDRVSNEELIRGFPGRSVDDIQQRTGIVTRPRAAANETALTLAVRAAREALEREDLSVVDLDAVICSSTTPLDISPSLACRTLHGLCCGKTVHEIPAYDISAACSGYLYALACAFGFLRSHPQAKVLVVTTEVLSRVVDPSDFDTAILFGDAASATLLGGRPEDFTAQARLLCPVLSASGEDGSTLRVPAPGCGFVEMNGRRIFTQAVRKMVDMLRRACSESAMDLHDLSLIVPHQANSRIIEAIRERLGMGEDRVVNNIARYGNTSSTSIPLALAEVLGDRRPGEKIGLTAFGAGYTYGAAILEVDRGNGGTSPS